MSFAQATFTSLRHGTLRISLRSARGREWDPFDRGPLRRDELSRMFETGVRPSLSPADRLRDSERQARDSARIVRGGLYPADRF